MRQRIIHHQPKPTGRNPGSLARGFTLVEIMCTLMIFALVATAGTYLMGAMASGQEFFREGTDSQSEVEFAIGRMVENVRAATAVASPSSTAVSSSLSLTAIDGSSVIYSRDANHNLTERIGTATSTLVHDVTSFSVAETSGNSKAFTITISAGTQEPISRTITVFGRNL